MKRFVALFFLAIIGFGFCPSPIIAADKNYVTWINIVRGREFWRVGKDIEFLTDQAQLLDNYQINSTWLIQYDALEDEQIREEIEKRTGDEKGIFMEVTPKLAKAGFVDYDWFSEKWERADKVFLSGYSREERGRLIDTVFERFKEIFGDYPKSVGAWHIDAWSLQYMRDKYGIEVVLGLADQYSTDGYQMWGQYVGFPYYPSKLAVLEPAADTDDKIDVVKLQWAMRHPLLGMGPSVENSNYSVQVNDYYRYHGLDKDYLNGLITDYIRLNVTDGGAPISHMTMGIEVGELEEKYQPGLEEQLQVIRSRLLEPVTMNDFAKVYKDTYPGRTPSISLYSRNGEKTIFWEMTPWYRAAILHENGLRKLVDLRFYHQSVFPENDSLSPDKRENLYRVVPAVIDKVGLGTDVELENTVIGYDHKLIRFRPPIDKNIFANQNANFFKLDGAFGVVPEIPKYPSNIEGKINTGDKIKLTLGGFIPDLRVSKLDGGWVMGVRTGSETLWGVDFNKLRIGKLYFEFPILESFLNLDKWRKPKVNIYARWEEELDRFINLGRSDEKDAGYGEGITNPAIKLFENSKYQIVDQL